ncbi:dehydrogenase of unknown specificity, short-chain alcohol dehydrogenase like protein [Serratia sp. FGI94]|uniref:SDR family oxidoreductase n=1 Tax=Serratia sp. FGI94 TaxID=671990 RepID=UPI0002A72911|nr:SDR family oxidoreductase [Serratia sp. FGI94]AGB84063.1 dehydrogenase of unknown specificity, short-chain alcohol dehydrogenase like protein [Serratia sp. FGI94]
MSTKERIALVTGASRGIGRAIAQRLAEEGFTVVVNYAGNAASAQETVRHIVDAGGKALAIQADVANDADVKRLFSETLALHQRLDVVVHNAGIMPMAKITPAGIDDFDKVIHTNLRGGFLILAHAAENISAGGRIIALTSSVLAKSFPAYGPYIASKAGMEGLVRVLANELRGRNVTVNAVAPGPTGTELFLQGKSEEQVNTLASLAPLERIGTPADIANTVAFLASSGGGWINAQVVRVNGGFA